MKNFGLIGFSVLVFLVVGCGNASKKMPNIKCITNTPKTEVEIASREYLLSLERFQAYQIKDKTYPKLFNVISENQFTKYMNDVLSSPFVNTSKFDTNLTQVGKVDCFSEGEFAPVIYEYKAHIEIIDPRIYNDESRYLSITNSLMRKYGDTNVIIDKKNRQKITIKSKEKMFAIKSMDSDWKFIVDSSDYRTLYAFIFPEDFLSKIK